MKKTFEELVNDFIKDNDLDHYSNLSFKEWVDFMRVVREKTLIETSTYSEDTEFKQSVLELDKDSIEI